MAATFRALPPGVYFNPSPEECVRDYLKPWAAGVAPPTDRVICGVDVFGGDSPDALLRGREPGFSRGFKHKWLLLSCSRGKKPAAREKRGVDDDRVVGQWLLVKKCREVDGAADGDELEEDDDGDEHPRGCTRRNYGFCLGKPGSKKTRQGKTPWRMEEFSSVEDAAGRKGDGASAVFCRIYLTPRTPLDVKRLILGECRVPEDHHGEGKLIMVEVSPELFDAIAQQAQGPAPPPHFLGFQQFQQGEPALRLLGHQQCQPPPPPPSPRFLGHQHGQAAASAAVLGDHHCRTVLPPAVPAYHHGHAMLPRGVPARHYAHARAAPHQGFLGYQQGKAAPRRRHVLDPYYNHEASPSVCLADLQQGEATTRMEKKLRLAYGSPAPQPQSSDNATSSYLAHLSTDQEQGVVIQLHDDNDQCGDTEADAKTSQEAEPVASMRPPPLEIPGTATAGSQSHEPPSFGSAPAPAELADDAGMSGAQPMYDPGIYVDLTDLEPCGDGLPDFVMHGGFKPPYDDDPYWEL